jgi:hypothetical protein
MLTSHSQQHTPVLPRIIQWCHVLSVKGNEKYMNTTKGGTILQMSAARQCQHTSRLFVLKHRMMNHEISSSFNHYEVLHFSYRRIIFEKDVPYAARATIVPFPPDTSSFSTPKFVLMCMRVQIAQYLSLVKAFAYFYRTETL